MKIRPLETELFTWTERHTDRQIEGITDGRSYMTTPIVAFRNFAN